MATVSYSKGIQAVDAAMGPLLLIRLLSQQISKLG